MDREPIRAGDFIQQRFLMRGHVERDTWKRTFPDVIPSTHEFFFEWDRDNTSVLFGIRPKTETKASTVIQSPAPSQVVNQAAELEKLSDADLETKAVEAGVAVHAGSKRKPKSLIAAEMASKSMGNPRE